MKKLKKNKSGFTLIEMVVSLLTVTIVTGLFVILVQLVSNTYVKLETNAEGQILSSTLTNIIQDELRYASNVKVKSETEFTYKSKTTGISGTSIVNGEVSESDKRERIYLSYVNKDTNLPEFYPLVGNSSYVFDLAAHIDISLNNSNDGFLVDLMIYRLVNGEKCEVINTNFEVIPLNKNFKKISVIEEES